MKKEKTIYMYSSYPLTEVKNYFKERLLKPLTYKQNIDKSTYLPTVSGFPKLYLLKVEHELSLNDSVVLHSSFLNDTDYECIYEIGKKFGAQIEYIFILEPMEKLYETYQKKKGTLSFEEFCNRYAEFYHYPLDRVDVMSFIQI